MTKRKQTCAHRFVAIIREDLDRFIARLTLFQQALDAFVELQAEWVALQPIFSNQDIQRQLPKAARQFAGAEQHVRATAMAAQEHPHALPVSAPSVLLWTQSCRLPCVCEVSLLDRTVPEEYQQARVPLLANACDVGATMCLGCGDCDAG
jgi:Dynein heavy chain, N-terminal region 2